MSEDEDNPKMGRPSPVHDPDFRARFFQAIKDGHNDTDACRLAGINPKTLINWRQRTEVYYVDFFREMDRLRVDLKNRALKAIGRSIDADNTDDARWYLERRWAREYGRQDAVKVQGDPDAPLTFKQIFGFTPDNFPKPKPKEEKKEEEG